MSQELTFTCVQCEAVWPQGQARLGCAQCAGKLFKVARSSTIYLPMMDDPDSQLDPYREKPNNEDVGKQFNNFGGEGTPTSTVGGPNDRPPQSENSSPDGRPLPSDGAGSAVPDSMFTEQWSDDSPLNQPTPQKDVSPFNFMRSKHDVLKPDDPYELLRKRKFR